MTHPFPISDKSKTPSLPIYLVSAKAYPAWLKKQSAATKAWLEANNFKAGAGNFQLLPGKDGMISAAICGVDETLDIWAIASMATSLPARHYHLEGTFLAQEATRMALGWALATYQFTRYKKSTKKFATLTAPKDCDMAYVKTMAAATFWARDLINTPANDMHPAALAAEAVKWANANKGKVQVIKGEALLKANYPMIYTVGKAAEIPPHLVDIRFARKGAPKVTLVGKGVCFDSGGLDIKSAAGMKMMKKDMGGAACVLALARAIIELKLPVQLRVLLPIVENAVAGNAMRPLDIVPTRKGINVEIGNTDAEGRLILCDALSEADDEQPDLLIDCATLTGAARVALGTDIPAFFTGDDELALALSKASFAEHDPLWRLPLWKGYRKQLDTNAADLSNDPDSSYGGAITAALYLQEFVSRTPSWLHIDMMAWNLNSRPGRPQGGEAMAIRALYAFLKERYDH
jgi:leucyl aminopeptidase